MFKICKKVPFVSRREAITALRRKNVPYGKPYKCPGCYQWHLGHKMPKKCKANIKKKNFEKKWEPLIRIVYEYCGV